MGGTLSRSAGGFERDPSPPPRPNPPFSPALFPPFSRFSSFGSTNLVWVREGAGAYFGQGRREQDARRAQRRIALAAPLPL